MQYTIGNKTVLLIRAMLGRRKLDVSPKKV